MTRANRRLPDADPVALGLDPRPIAEADALLRSGTEAEQRPPTGGPDADRARAVHAHAHYAGAVGLLAHAGHVVGRHVSGWALRHADEHTELPREAWLPMRSDTVFDLASVTKVFTAIAVVQLVEEGRLDLSAPVAAHLPEFGANGKEAVTVSQLLTHTSGCAATLPLWSRWPDPATRIAAALAEPPVTPPGTTYRYSDLNLIALGVLVERLRGAPLDVVVHERISTPLGMTDTGYRPTDRRPTDRRPTDRRRTAATEFQASPPRGLVHDQVHDENAWALGGVAGHAGLFSTADDLAVLAQTLLDGGSHGSGRILQPQSVTALATDVNAAFPGHAHGLGLELDQPGWMGDLSGPRTAGHTGYTGTSVVISFDSRSFAVLLTNRVHPSRVWGSAASARLAWANGLARALPVDRIG
ncbi:MAG: estB [Humibacillus sp.]|nr:estB [Humibacillus sp.]